MYNNYDKKICYVSSFRDSNKSLLSQIKNLLNNNFINYSCAE